ncbi:tyrosine-type recombinase/integrase [Ideonella livida]|uniref:Integrase arm-type DNA-binding domain-containing protein n=1 Tax=Ideonella livida TaxID=2707176 RepID=A0A7C9PFA4_9BURK|nr:integrase arm-type DNA-binding domain-containing protein [Ideonella livida]NDY90151.1 integrase arm-type DNA-binding domain-containing protein [Ideonella livida]
MARELIPGDTTIRNIKPGDSRRRLSDGAGLYLLLFVKGGAHGWRLDYSVQGVRKTLSLGTYPDTGLALARRKAEEARALVSQGVDPSDVRKQARADAQRQHQEAKREAAGLPPVDAFEPVAREWLERVHSHKVSANHAERTRIRLEQDLFPWLGRLPLAAIKAPDVLACLRRVEGRGALETAHRVRQAAGQVFRYGVATGRCERDPTTDLRDALPPVRTSHHAAITEPGRVGELLRAFDDYRGHAVTRAALRLAPLVFQRPGELRAAEWAEMDLTASTWTIPAARMKRSLTGKATGAPHLVPLSLQAVAVLQELQPLTGHGRFCFPSPRTDERPLSDNAILSALRRMGFGKDEMSGHGVRAMARTLLHERLNFPPEVIEAQLAHAVPDALGRAYNRTEFLDQRRTMMQAWADYLDRLKRGGADVVPLRPGNAAA